MVFENSEGMNHNFAVKMIRSISIILILLSMVDLSGQEVNITDSKGLKQGLWKKYYEGTENLFYQGTFKDDQPVGEFTYYYEKGQVKGTMDYQPGGGKVRNKTFYTNGKVMAEGIYIDKKKDSIWNYFTKEGILSSVEVWDRGAKHGLEKVFFDDGTLAEETVHVDGLRNGDWKQYYESGKLRLHGIFVRDRLDGPITYYYANGANEIKGKFLAGLREGTWMYFNEDGSVREQIVYREGDIEKEKKENGTFIQYGPDNIILSSVTYVKGLREGEFQEYHDDASFEFEKAIDKLTGESYMKQVKVGNELKRVGTYKNDQLHGEVKHYNEKGILTGRENYINGEKQ